jgi:hypothetical protein
MSVRDSRNSVLAGRPASAGGGALRAAAAFRRGAFAKTEPEGWAFGGMIKVRGV